MESPRSVTTDHERPFDLRPDQNVPNAQARIRAVVARARNNASQPGLRHRHNDAMARPVRQAHEIQAKRRAKAPVHHDNRDLSAVLIELAPIAGALACLANPPIGAGMIAGYAIWWIGGRCCL